MFDIAVESQHGPDTIDRIRDGLKAFNEAHVGSKNTRQFAIVVRDESGEIRGGLIAEEHWGWLYVDALWVAEKIRRQGLGSELLRQAEVIAFADGCRYSYLSTGEFQAPRFYERHGYVAAGVLEDFPAGSGFRRIYLRKVLASTANR